MALQFLKQSVKQSAAATAGRGKKGKARRPCCNIDLRVGFIEEMVKAMVGITRRIVQSEIMKFMVDDVTMIHH